MFLRLLLISTLALIPATTFASVTITPLFIEHTVAARDIVKDSVTLTNDTSVPLRVFASVNAIALDEGGAIKEFIPPSMSDRSTSVTSWIEVSRGRIELAPGQTQTIPITLRISPSVVPGTYVAYLGFSQGADRDEAEAKTISGQGNGIIVRLHIEDDRSSILELMKFSVDRFVSTFSPHTASYSINNPGEIPLTPKGEVVLYNARGEEIQSLLLNENNTQVAPGETMNFSVPIDAHTLFGKYKAFLRVNYGDDQKAAVYDTTFFYAAPLSYLIGIFVSIFVTIISLLLWWHHRFAGHPQDDHDGYVSVFVRDGVLSTEKQHDINLSKPPQQ